VRRADPAGVTGLPPPASGPQHVTAVGLALYGARHRAPRTRVQIPVNAGLLGRMGGRLREWFSEMF